MNKTRYNFGGDEYIFVEFSEEFSLETSFKVIAITKEIKKDKVDGIIDVCPGNASYMINYDPDKISPADLIDFLKEKEEKLDSSPNLEIESRIVEIPVFFEDPWTKECLMKFRDRHQSPNLTDIEYCAQINGYSNTKDFINAMTSSPYLTFNVGFVPGLPWCYQLVRKEDQIEVPKYVKPRTETPERSFGWAGAFGLIYPSAGTGGAQIFGICPAPVFAQNSLLPDFQESMIFPKPGDIYKFISITHEEYDSIRQEVENNTFKYKIKEFSFSSAEVLKDIEEFGKRVIRRLYA